MSKLNSKIIKVSNDKSFHFLSIGEYDDNIEKLITDNLVAIWDGILSDTEVGIVKKQFLIWFDGKDDGKKIGFVAEFFCHLYMKQLKFKQHFLFKNLEETNSMKKGFDGLYQKKNEIWLYESKSSLPTTTKATHNGNIGEAYWDISKKINGSKKDKKGNSIDPWDNAINHAGHFHIKKDITLLNNLKEYRKRFFEKDFEKIDDFNVIPSSTIYLEENWKEIDDVELEKNLIKLTKNYKFKKINIICINKKSIKNFINFISK